MNILCLSMFSSVLVCLSRIFTNIRINFSNLGDGGYGSQGPFNLSSDAFVSYWKTDKIRSRVTFDMYMNLFPILFDLYSYFYSHYYIIIKAYRKIYDTSPK